MIYKKIQLEFCFYFSKLIKPKFFFVFISIYNIFHRPWYHLVHMSRLLFLYHYSISILFLLERSSSMCYSHNSNSTCHRHFHNFRYFRTKVYPCSPHHNHFPIFSHIKPYLCSHTTKSPIKKELISLNAFYFFFKRSIE